MFGLAFGIGAFVFCAAGMNSPPMRGWRAWFELVHNATTTSATVTHVVRQEHQRCDFEYAVQSVRYRGMDEGCSANVGDTLVVSYSPRNPSFATTRCPQWELGLQVGACCAMSLLAGLLGAAWSLRRRSWGQKIAAV